jgi:para-nitrobenzyl esterase
MAPQPHRPRPGLRSATAFAAGCFQDDYNARWYQRVAAAFGATGSVFTDPPFSEDCLYLNVWTPDTYRKAHRPVMVWIHGGSNKAGWSFEPNYRAGVLAARGDVVVVTVAYRLGVFGYFGHPDMGTRDPVNFGLLDQIAALRWVQREIAKFGGDPGNVTIFGESAGAANVGYLLYSPPAQGLYLRAIAESGGYQMMERSDRRYALEVGDTLSGALQGHPGLAALRRLPASEVFAAASRHLAGHDWHAVVDGDTLPASPAEAYTHDGVDHDVLTGSNENEYHMYVDGDPSQYRDALAALPAAARARLEARGALEPDVHSAHDRVSTLVHMACPPYLIADAATRRGHRAWVYRFTRVRPGPGGREFLAYHGAEIPYVFDTHDAWLAGDANEAVLTTAMMGYWTRFARTGNPNDQAATDWPPFSASEPRVIDLGSSIFSRPAPDHAICTAIAPEIYRGWVR